MADVKISGLPASTTPLDGTEVLPIVQGTTTKQVSIANVTAGRAVSFLSVTSTNDASIAGITVGKGNGSVSTNTAVGVSALSATTGGNQVAVGYQALKAVTSGVNNAAIGPNALASLLTGNSNVAIGINALQTTTTGTSNVAIGQNALASSTSNQNIGIGTNALTGSTNQNNVGVGYSVGAAITSGANNTLIGSQAGNTGTNNLTTGFNNILIGYQAQASSATVSNEITIGNSSSKVIRYPHSYSTVANLPAATIGQGSRTFVTDALTPVFQATVTGGGAVFTPVYSNGTNWVVG